MISVKIRKVGTGLVATIPSKVAKEKGLKEGQLLEVRTNPRGCGLRLIPIKDSKEQH